MLVALLSFALAARAAVPEQAPVAAAPGVLIAQVVACGVRRRDTRIRVDDTLQEAVVDVRPAAAPSDAQLSCLARVSAETTWFLVFDAAAQARFEPLYARASEVVWLARARAWIAAHGLAARVPQYREGRDDRAATVARIERLCAAPPGSFHDLFLAPEHMAADTMPAVPDETWLCVSHVATVAGLKLEFIGNAAEDGTGGQH